MATPIQSTGPTSAQSTPPSSTAARPGQVPRGTKPAQRLVAAGARLVFDERFRGARGGRSVLEHVDWEASAGLRRRLDGAGYALAEGLDLAQRVAQGWPVVERLLAEHAQWKLAHGFLCGAAADHLPHGPTIQELIEGIAFQANAIEEKGGVPVILPMTLLARRRATEGEYVQVYRSILERVHGPVLIDWIGPRYSPLLSGYFPGKSFERVLELDPAKVRGARLAWLDASLVARLRRELLTRDQLVFTGDDPLFARWLLGGNPGSAPTTAVPAPRATELAGRQVALGEFSHGILGLAEILGAPARSALAKLDAGDVAGYLAAVEPLEVFTRWLLRHPTHLEAHGAQLAWAEGRQENAYVADHGELALDADERRELFERARAAGVLENAARAGERLTGPTA